MPRGRDGWDYTGDPPAYRDWRDAETEMVRARMELERTRQRSLVLGFLAVGALLWLLGTFLP